MPTLLIGDFYSGRSLLMSIKNLSTQTLIETGHQSGDIVVFKYPEDQA